jgi:hypothetical protein
MQLKPDRNPGPALRVKVHNISGESNIARIGSRGQLRYQTVVWEASNKAYSRATYGTEAAAKAARGSESKKAHVYDLSLRMRII